MFLFKLLVASFLVLDCLGSALGLEDRSFTAVEMALILACIVAKLAAIVLLFA